MLRVLRQRRVGEVLAITLAARTSMFTITPLLALFLRPKIFVYSTACECVRVGCMIRLVKSLGTSWTVMSAKLRYRFEIGEG